MDNRLTAKMAAVSSRDGSAMKTLAFMTTLFLPGTFVAVCPPNPHPLATSSLTATTECLQHRNVRLAAVLDGFHLQSRIFLFLGVLGLHDPTDHSCGHLMAPMVGLGKAELG